MAKIKEKDLAIGDLCWMNETKSDLFWYVGLHDGNYWFYPKTNNTGYLSDTDGTVPFADFPYCYEYEEVE